MLPSWWRLVCSRRELGRTGPRAGAGPHRDLDEVAGGVGVQLVVRVLAAEYSPGGPSGDASANVVRKSRRWMERAWKAEYTCACVMSWSCACGAPQGPARLRSSHPRPGAGSAARGAAAGMRRTPHDAHCTHRRRHCHARMGSPGMRWPRVLGERRAGAARAHNKARRRVRDGAVVHLALRYVQREVEVVVAGDAVVHGDAAALERDLRPAHAARSLQRQTCPVSSQQGRVLRHIKIKLHRVLCL